MRTVDLSLIVEDEIIIKRETVMSGIRPAGRSTNNLPHGRSVNGLLYIWEGEAIFSPEDAEEIKVSSGELVFLPKGCRYSMKYTAETNTFVLVNFEMQSESGEDLVFSDRIQIAAHDDENRRIAAIAAKLELCGGSRNPSAFFRRKELVGRLLSMAFCENSTIGIGNFKYPMIIPGVILLQQSYLENIPIAVLAEKCMMSVSSFRAQFSKQFGMSPIQYRNKLRIERAKAILSDGSCSVSEAAYLSGFDNLGYFCRYYKKLVGETPGETRDRVNY